MKKILSYVLIFLSYSILLAQERALENNHQEGLNKAKQGDYVGAIASFTKAIEVLPLDAYAWYNRGMAKNMIGEYEDALNDFGTCIGLNPAYGKVWFNRGLTKMYLGRYDGAIVDLTQAIQIEREYAAAYYHRAYLYELKGLYDFACTDYRNAQSKGFEVPRIKINACKDSLYEGFEKNPLLLLTEKSSSRCYGTTKKHPIQVGNLANMERYLRLLRSPKGSFIYYTVISSEALSTVKISYTQRGKEKTKLLYFDLTVSDHPKLLKRFSTIKAPNLENHP